MRVLLLTAPGPSTEQNRSAASRSLEVIDELTALGVDATLAASVAPDISPYDLLHLLDSGDAEWTFRHVLRARAARQPLVLTPTWDVPEGGAAPVDNDSRPELLMRQIALGLADALVTLSQAQLETISSQLPVVPRTIGVVPQGGLAARAVPALARRRAAEAILAVYTTVMSDRETNGGDDWRAALSPDQYIEHLESLIQLQLETIALRDSHYADARETAERATEYAQALEQELARGTEHARALEADRDRLQDELRLARAEAVR